MCELFGKTPRKLRDLLNQAALVIDCVPEPSKVELELVTELRSYQIAPESEWQRRALAAEAEVARLRAEAEGAKL